MKTPNIVYLPPEHFDKNGGIFSINSGDHYSKKYYSEDLIAEIRERIHAEFAATNELLLQKKKLSIRHAYTDILEIIDEVLKDE